MQPRLADDPCTLMQTLCHPSVHPPASTQGVRAEVQPLNRADAIPGALFS